MPVDLIGYRSNPRLPPTSRPGALGGEHLPGHMARRLSRSVAIAGALAGAATLPMGAFGASELSTLVPGVTYERIERPGQVTHVVRAIQGPLIDIKPVLTAGFPTKRGTLTGAMRARLGDGAVIGMNGDYFNLENAYPSGLLMNLGEIVNEPEPTRSAIVFGSDGRLTTGIFTLVGKWQASDPTVPAPFAERGFIGVNRPPEADATGTLKSETIVYTPRFGDITPTGDKVDALIAMDPPGDAVPNTPLTGTVQTVQPGGGVGIGPGKMVISGVRNSADNVIADLVPGRRVTITFGLEGLPPAARAAIGGGPNLVENGVPITGVSEGFSSGQKFTRTSRTALGQAADGTVMLVASEGPFQGSRGVTMVEQAELLASLGAQTAIGMDGGGSSMMALHDRLLTPWASERAITNAVVVTYGGVQLTRPNPLVSPNGDGIDDATRTTARAPKDGTARINLVTSGGRLVRTLFSGAIGPPGRRIRLPQDIGRVADGRYRVVARFAPSDGSAPTIHRQEFVVDRSIGHLRLQKVGAKPDTRLRIGFRVGTAARVTVLVKNAAGGSVKLLFRDRRLAPGSYSLTWDMKRGGKPLKPGIYTVSLRSRSVGRPALSARFTAPAPKPTPTG